MHKKSRTAKSQFAGIATAIIITAMGACDDPSPTAPQSNVAVPELASFATGAPFVYPTSLCLATAGNPYKCCANDISKGYYGNCTLGAWELAKQYWQNIRLPYWGDAKDWAAKARAADFFVDAAPSKLSIGVGSSGELGNHVAMVMALVGKDSVLVREQQCGPGYRGGFIERKRAIRQFTGGFIRAPIPEVKLYIWQGTSSIGNGGTLTVQRNLLGKATVNFGFGTLRSNVNIGPSSYLWTIGANGTSTAGTFAQTFTLAGSYKVTARVTNAMGRSTTVSATVIVK